MRNDESDRKDSGEPMFPNATEGVARVGVSLGSDIAPTIWVSALSKAYEGTHAVSSLSLEVRPGKILGLVGPNGAGKTTSLRCMAGIIPPTSGAIRIDGYDLLATPIEAKSRLAFVPDTPHLFDYLTVEEHLNFAARIYQVPDWRARAESLLHEFELVEKRRHLPQALSRGMRQKVAICLGFLHDPRAIILDEPLTGLDPLGIRRMKDAILKRARGNGAAVIVSSHQLELIEEICDEVLVIRSGRAVIQGTLASIRERLGAADEQLSLEAIFFRVMSAADATAPSIKVEPNPPAGPVL